MDSPAPVSRFATIDKEKISLDSNSEVAVYIRQKMDDPLDPQVENALRFIAESRVVGDWNLKHCYTRLRALTVVIATDTSTEDGSSENIMKLVKDRTWIDEQAAFFHCIWDTVWWLKFEEEAKQQTSGTRRKFYQAYAELCQEMSNDKKSIKTRIDYLSRTCSMVSSRLTIPLEVFGFGIIAYMPDEFTIANLTNRNYTTAVFHGLTKILMMRKEVELFRDLCECMQSLVKDMFELGRKASISRNVRAAWYLLQMRQPQLSKQIGIPGPDVQLGKFAQELATTDLDSLRSNQEPTIAAIKLITDVIVLGPPHKPDIEVYTPGKALIDGHKLSFSGGTVKADKTLIPTLVKSPNGFDYWFATYVDWHTETVQIFDPSHESRATSSSEPTVSLWDEISHHLVQLRPQENPMCSPKLTLAKFRSRSGARCEDSGILVLQYIEEVLSGKLSYFKVDRLREKYFVMAVNHVWLDLTSPHSGLEESVTSDGNHM